VSYDIEVTGIASIRYAIYHFLLVVCTNSDSIWHHFRDISSFTMYLTDCDLEKLFVFEITRRKRLGLCINIARYACCISQGVRDRKASDSRSDLWGHYRSPVWCYSI